MTKRVLFLGTPEFAVPGLEALIAMPGIEVVAVMTQPDRPAGRGKKFLASPIKKVAVKHSLPLLQPESVKREWDVVKKDLDALGPVDCAVVIAFGQILPLSFLEHPLKGCLNVHASLLPRWRGAAPIQRAVLSGDSESGVCLMHITEGLDSGPVYASLSHTLTPEETSGSLHDALSLLGARVLKQSLLDVLNGNCEALEQPEDGVTYARKIKKQEASIDWSRPAEEIERHVRGFYPFPGAYTKIDGKRIKILSATDCEAPVGMSGQAGEILLCDRDSFEVCCGDTRTLKISEVQIEGKKRMPVEEFVKGYPTLLGTRFESGDTV